MSKQFTKKQIEVIVGQKEVSTIDKAPVKFSDSKSNELTNPLDFELDSKIDCYDYMGCYIQFYKYYRIPKTIPKEEVVNYLPYALMHYEIKNEKKR